ncbi:MAG: alanine--glyoxylate aminotransferase family protein [Gemmatimonadetes bacterium]|nr:alanine--glyoxylate aminotransferase family protein [Gemmatimonadota bacterium]MYF74762.1 alanine--glyoxylate aminotransferase family protein [Gemmatimonadota bacterium]MYK51156.1 alanine--glyoxylate aminotransferase family protein [Gemmatimonadota bacterium]
MSSALAREIANLRLPALALWAPGPHMLTPAVRRVLQTYQTTYSHRSAAFQACYQKTVDLLREVFQIPRGFTPLIFGHTGSYNWEMVVTNTPCNSATLGMDIGAFSKKWAQIFTSHGRNIDILKAAWGDGICARTWSNAIAKNYDLALLTHNETSTGVMLPVQEMCDTVRNTSPKTLIAIDAVSIAGASDTPIETLRPDYYLWSLQKDFACPTIGSVMIVSDRAFDIAANTPNRGYVLDLIEWRTRAKTAQTPMTVADLTLQCLNARLEEMKREGDQRFKRHQSLAHMQREWARKHGLNLIAKPGYESLTVNAILLPDYISGSDFVDRAKKLLNVQLAPGYGDTRDKAFRIAAMGHTSECDMRRVLRGISLILNNWSKLE